MSYVRGRAAARQYAARRRQRLQRQMPRDRSLESDRAELARVFGAQVEPTSYEMLAGNGKRDAPLSPGTGRADDFFRAAIRADLHFRHRLKPGEHARFDLILSFSTAGDRGALRTYASAPARRRRSGERAIITKTLGRAIVHRHRTKRQPRRPLGEGKHAANANARRQAGASSTIRRDRTTV